MTLSFQLLQKYERGTSRTSVSRLSQLAAILQVPVGFFFETCTGRTSAVGQAGPHLDTAIFLLDFMKKTQTRELVRAFYAVESQQHRDAVLKLLKTMAPVRPPCEGAARRLGPFGAGAKAGAATGRSGARRPVAIGAVRHSGPA